MQLKKYLTILSALLLVLISTGCAVQDRVIVKTELVKPNITIQTKPKGVNLHPVKFYAVSEKNFDEFIQKFEKENGDLVFFAISVTDYENLSLNVAELRRYIEQQKSLIVYYETSIIMIDMNTSSEEEVKVEGTISSIKNKLGLK
jgi:hypothetical protein